VRAAILYRFPFEPSVHFDQRLCIWSIKSIQSIPVTDVHSFDNILHNNMAYHQPQPRYGHCDSYFVESHDHDDGYYAIRAEARERARAIAKLQQRALAEELSKLTADEYQEDVMDHMEYMEVGDYHFLES
jgi:hypothetical protein